MSMFVEYPLHVVFGCAGLWLSHIDLREHRLPNWGTAGMGVWCGGLALLGVAWGVETSERLAHALMASALGTGFFLLLAVLPPRALGLGDVKLQAALGFYLGWFDPQLVIGQIIGAFLLGGMAAGGLVISRKMAATEHLAFGPFMIAAAAVMVWWGKSLEII
jgi:leader peptidase (prepilin peptidase) / N-methyltransferase